jgi:hypothetical protein
MKAKSSEEPDSTATTSKPGVTASNTNEGKQDSKKKDGGKNRRHHSDINLAANVGQLLKVKGQVFTSFDKSVQRKTVNSRFTNGWF